VKCFFDRINEARGVCRFCGRATCKDTPEAPCPISRRSTSGRAHAEGRRVAGAPGAASASPKRAGADAGIYDRTAMPQDCSASIARDPRLLMRRAYSR